MTAIASSEAPTRTFREQVEALNELRPFPAAAARLAKASQDPTSNSKALAEIIQCDAGLAVRLLRVANSSVYGFSKEICTVDHAVVVLGFRAVRELALSLATADIIATGETAQEAREALWQHSLGCATVGRMLAPSIGTVDPEEAFLAGIVHDVGKLVFFDLAAEQYAAVAEDPSMETLEGEQQKFGITHPEIGRLCGEQWALPDSINLAISDHHLPGGTGAADDLVIVTFLANRLSKAWGVGVLDPVEEDVEGLLAEVNVTVDTAQLEAMNESAHVEFEVTQRAYQP